MDFSSSLNIFAKHGSSLNCLSLHFAKNSEYNSFLSQFWKTIHFCQPNKEKYEAKELNSSFPRNKYVVIFLPISQYSNLGPRLCFSFLDLKITRLIVKRETQDLLNYLWQMSGIQLYFCPSITPHQFLRKIKSNKIFRVSSVF